MMNNKIYAVYDEKTIRVYQAFNDIIVDEVAEMNNFGKSFSLNRMTWIKPSFLWMMYRSGWGTKESQNRILAIDMDRDGFDFIVKNAVLSSFSEEIYNSIENWKNALDHSDIRCQWDPQRDLFGNPQEIRTIQLGIKGNVLKRYLHKWIIKITDITQEVAITREAIKSNVFSEKLLPLEKEYYVKCDLLGNPTEQAKKFDIKNL